MKKGVKFVLKVLTFIIVMQLILTNTIQAASTSVDWSEILDKGDEFLEDGKYYATSDSDSASDIKTIMIMDDLYSIIFPLGVVTTVIVGAALGIKFMLASAEDKAKVKESMVPYVAGCVVIYGAFGIWRIVIEVFSALS